MPISFVFNSRKAIEVICWLVNEEPGIDLYAIVKAIYFADKEHLQLYGRPVIGDRYFAMQHGMVPSITYDILKGRGGRHGDDLRSILDDVVTMQTGDPPTFNPLRAPRGEFLSGSDIRCLREALGRCRGLSFDQLKALAHQERAYREAWDSRSSQGVESVGMDYEAIIDDDLPERDRLLRELRESASAMAL